MPRTARSSLCSKPTRAEAPATSADSPVCTRPTVTERIARLKDIGVVRRFATQIDYAKAGLPTSAIIEFKPHRNNDAKAYEFAVSRAEVRDIYLVTGSALMVLIVRLADNQLLNDLLVELTRFGETKTSVILNTIDEWRPVFSAESAALEGANEGCKE